MKEVADKTQRTGRAAAASLDKLVPTVTSAMADQRREIAVEMAKVRRTQVLGLVVTLATLAAIALGVAFW